MERRMIRHRICTSIRVKIRSSHAALPVGTVPRPYCRRISRRSLEVLGGALLSRLLGVFGQQLDDLSVQSGSKKKILSWTNSSNHAGNDVSTTSRGLFDYGFHLLGRPRQDTSTYRKISRSYSSVACSDFFFLARDSPDKPGSAEGVTGGALWTSSEKNHA